MTVTKKILINAFARSDATGKPVKLNERELILANLANFIKQRPGLEYRNYCSGFSDTAGRAAYFAELRGITKDLHHARALLAQIGWRESITAEKLKEAFRAFSGRLTWDGKKLDYCTGQYFPTEYRRAVCAVAASALWDYWRDNLPKGRLVHNSETGETFERYTNKGIGAFDMRAADFIRATAKKELGASIAKRWFK